MQSYAQENNPANSVFLWCIYFFHMYVSIYSFTFLLILTDLFIYTHEIQFCVQTVGSLMYKPAV